MKRRDWWVMGGVAALALLLLILGRLQHRSPVTLARPTLTLNLAGQAQGKAPPAADSYLRIKQGDEYYQLVALNGPADIRILQEGGWENIIRIDKNSVRMHSANCPNQDCVRMGEMTLINIETRFHQRWITCLPHYLSLELIPAPEAQRLLEIAP